MIDFSFAAIIPYAALCAFVECLVDRYVLKDRPITPLVFTVNFTMWILLFLFAGFIFNSHGRLTIGF